MNPLNFSTKSEPSEKADVQYHPPLSCYELLTLGLLQHFPITSQIRGEVLDLQHLPLFFFYK